MLQLIQLLQSINYDVIFASPAAKGDHCVDLEKWHVVSQSIALNCSSFDDWLSTVMPDLVMFDRFMMEEQFSWRVDKVCPDAIKLLDSEDLHFLRHARHEALKQAAKKTSEPVINSPVFQQLPFNAGNVYENGLQNDMALREIASIYRCDLTLTISRVEIDILTTQFNIPAQQLCYCPFLISGEEPADSPDFETRHGFVTIGNFRHAPNWDGVLQLKQHVWPLIRKRLPSATLSIFGAYPPPKATALTDTSTGFLVKGWAESATDEMKKARVCLAPLRFGAGLKGKLVEAMACGTPSVTTSIGAEGLAPHTDWSGAVSDELSSFADAAILLHEDKSTWSAAQRQGFNLLQRHFNSDEHQNAVITQIQQVVNHRQQHRSANFTGQMLRHHAHRSTQFMSQWIEAKTKLATVSTNEE